MVRNIIISIFLIFLFGCKEIYFKHPQPKGGKVFNGNLKQMLKSAIPNTINSDDRNSVLNKIANDTLQYISMSNSKNHLDLEIRFSSGTTILEKFNSQNHIDSFLTLFDFDDIAELIILEKENIVCINEIDKKVGKEVYDVRFTIETSRRNNDARVSISPFLFGQFLDEEHISFSNEFDIIKYYDSDSSVTYIADPSYMSFRKYLKKSNTASSFSDLIIFSLFEQLQERVESDSIKYQNIKGLINFKYIEGLYLPHLFSR